MFSVGFKQCESSKHIYRENNSVDYKVFLKENSFFEKPYLEKDKTYITSLIDYIESNFAYHVDFDETISGEISYQMMAEIKADKVNNDVGNYWTKLYTLTNSKTEKVADQKEFDIHMDQKINYNKYNKLMKSFIEEYGLQTEATLRVYLNVSGKVTIDNTDKEIPVESQVSLIVPLSKKAIEGKIETKNDSIEKEIITTTEKKEPLRQFFRILFFIVLIVFVYHFGQYILFLMNKNNHLNYRDTIKQINSDYEEIITKVKSINTTDFAIIDVETFEDLLNVYASVREQINFLYGNDESKFFILKGNTCYMYTINKEEKMYDEKNKK